METPELTERQQVILTFVVRSYIADGEPVASGAVARSGVVDVSSATIRNTMASLEAQGLLAQPHTSAGRIPTMSGLRYFVDEVASRYQDINEVDVDLDPLRDRPPSEVARLAGTLLSDVSHLAGIVLGPRLERVRLRDVRIVALRPEKLLAVVVTEDGRALERVVLLDTPVDPITLTRAQNYLSEFVSGHTLRELRERVQRELSEAQSAYRDHVRTALAVSAQVAEGEQSTTQVHVEGHLNLLDHADVSSDSERVRELLRALEDRKQLAEILDAMCDSRQPVTLIGPEGGGSLGDSFSLVICGYYRGLEQAGLVGVLGPVRMNYARMIPLVDRTARMLSRELVIGD